MKLLFGHEEIVQTWCEGKANTKFSNLLGTIGALDDDGNLIGAAILHDYLKHDVELSFYGPKTLSLDMCKAIAWLAFIQGGVQRITIHVARKKKRLLRAFPRLGWKYEGVRRHHFGPFKNDDGIMFGILRSEASMFLRGIENEVSARVA